MDCFEHLVAGHPEGLVREWRTRGLATTRPLHDHEAAVSAGTAEVWKGFIYCIDQIRMNF